MHRDEFSYELPSELIAQYPASIRGDSRLLCLDGNKGDLSDKSFSDLPDLLTPDDLLVFNDTRVIPARLYGEKETGGKVEIMVERIMSERCILAQIRASKSPRVNSNIYLEQNFVLKIIKRQEEMYVMEFNDNHTAIEAIDLIGHVPLPPYIHRVDQLIDSERYQTVFAREPGAVAAPTAGLHFNEDMLEILGKKGINTAYITLHVGAGTFQPVRSAQVEHHKMHREYMKITEDVCEKINSVKKNGGRIIAVGTTSVRTLETAACSGIVKPFSGETDIFIYPGYKFEIIDALITNFHLPESTLLMLVCAFAGKKQVLSAYQHAITEQYRFYSYGDAMFITANKIQYQ